MRTGGCIVFGSQWVSIKEAIDPRNRAKSRLRRARLSREPRSGHGPRGAWGPVPPRRREGSGRRAYWGAVPQKMPVTRGAAASGLLRAKYVSRAPRLGKASDPPLSRHCKEADAGEPSGWPRSKECGAPGAASGGALASTQRSLSLDATYVAESPACKALAAMH